MTDYFRPIPCETGRWQLAGGWVRFSQFELLRRGEAPRVVDSAPDAVLEALTAPRVSLLGLSMQQPRIMGIVNTTPDSFSDGGTYDGAGQVRLLAGQGAEILDIGGESTRPGAREVPVAEEIDRVTPAIEAARGLAVISVDTRKAEVARAAVDAGAHMVNDVSGFDFDPDMAGMVAASGVPVCLMHAQGIPETMQDNPTYGDVLLDVYDALAERIARAEAAGIARDRIVIDPGIGFGKTQEHNLAILRRISLYHGLGCAVLLGVSRKRFIGSIGGVERPADRVAGTLALTLAGIAQGIQIHRVHDVAETRQGIALWRAATTETG
ncbi:MULTISPECIES: dihydropteroate synthase [unclassified Paracoccus (in: a-proteobacteria)]|uniref:dihydropteroate synthase n=1 Tax=unclassified Paracoccus (in: a-proteobacteria) TaxID=2688777 RepID=UPI000225F36A|nr:MULTISPECIES: dihydropteroate synthase [unclassified Paracoccus (in: a-proteobacteria)]SMG12793.1 Dihydropteroate synthase [Paracoccus sp. J56]